MIDSRLGRSVLVIGLMSAAGVWGWREAVSAEPTAKATRLATEDLGGAERYLTHVTTDKPIYRIGEPVYVRALVLRADTRAPLDGGGSAFAQVVGPKGDIVASGYANLTDAAAGFTWKIPDGQPGGQYTLKVNFPNEGYTPGERKFDIRAYRAPRLKSQIEFVRDGYGPGDRVAATVEVTRAEGGVPADAKVTVIARVDGVETHRSQSTIDAQGRCTAQFDLPKEIDRGEGTLLFVIEDGGVAETAAKTIPILLQTVDLNVYPEGGDLVAGLTGRVYIEARTPAQKPADLAGYIDEAGKPGVRVAEFRTEHEGRARFEFTPTAGGQYQLHITQPAGITRAFDLPAVKEAGAVIRAKADLFAKGEPVELTVATTGDKPFAVTLSKREAEVARAQVKGSKDPTEVSLTPPEAADGVLIATVWNEAGVPIAERLIYREPAKSVNVSITADQSRYIPGGRAKLTVTTTDEDGKPVSALVGLTVTDDSVLEMIDKREQAPRLPVMVLLEPEVRELADAQVYLDAANPEAPAALDLLLGTQGWRRLAIVHGEQFMAEHGDAARRALAFRVVTVRELRKAQFARPEAALFLADGAVEQLQEEAVPLPAPVALEAAPAPGQDLAAADAQVAAEAQPAAPEAELAEPAADRPAPQNALAKRLEEAQERADADQIVAGRRAPNPVANDFVVVREYAHAVREGRKPGQRTDFTETLYWNAGVRTDPKTGQATASFALSDSVTSFRVLADAVGPTGALGAAAESIESVEPFYIEPKLPLEVTVGDTVLLPIGMVNSTGSAISGVRVSGSASGVDMRNLDPIDLAADSRVRQIMQLTIRQPIADAEFVLEATGGGMSDRVTRRLRAVPSGFPIVANNGGMLSDGSPVAQIVQIPDQVVAGSLRTKLTVYPTPLANLTGAVERLIQEPNGCFEQSSSTVYPLAMAQQYFTTHTGVDPAIIRRARETLDRGYAKLIGFECKQRGYEWFGGDPGHEALTAYGLMEFTDIAKTREVDADMLARTRKWLLDRRADDGTFKRNEQALDSFGGAPTEHTNAYVTWSLLVAGEKGLEPQIAAVGRIGDASADSYVVALAANVMNLADDKEAARRFTKRLAEKQNKTTGVVEGGVTSITRSGGQSLDIETTALAVLAWLADPSYAANAEAGIKYLAESCEGGRFGSTQATVLALRSIVAYDQARAVPKHPGSIRAYVDGKPVGEPVAFTVDTQGAIELPDLASHLSAGRHSLELRMTDGSPMPCALAVHYNSLTPATSDRCKLDLSVKLRNDQLTEGNATEAEVTVTNTSSDGLPTPIAIVGIPGGLEVRHDQLKELVKAGTIDAYEVIGREVILYWRQLKPQQRAGLSLSLVAAIPGSYTAPASRAYLYYTDEHKHWTPGLTVTIDPLDSPAKR